MRACNSATERQIAKSKLLGSSLKHGESADSKGSIFNFSHTRLVFSFAVTYESRYEQPTDIVAADSMLRNPNLESHLLLTHAKIIIDSMLRNPNLESPLLITHAKIIKDFEKEIKDFPEHACCSCERLHQRKYVTKIKLSDKLSSEVWPRLTSFITQNNVHVPGTLYICNYCKPLIQKNILPPRWCAYRILVYQQKSVN